MTPFKAKLAYAGGVFTLSIVTGLAVYQSPPSSLEEFSVWIWQPSMQGLMQAIGTLGIGGALRSVQNGKGR